MSVFGFVKGVVEFATSAGTGMVISNIVKTNTPANLSKVGKVLTGIGSFAIGGVVSELVSRATVNKMDEIVEAWQGKQSNDFTPAQLQEMMKYCVADLAMTTEVLRHEVVKRNSDESGEPTFDFKIEDPLNRSDEEE